jgi:hypothetical protein
VVVQTTLLLLLLIGLLDSIGKCEEHIEQNGVQGDFVLHVFWLYIIESTQA